MNPPAQEPYQTSDTGSSPVAAISGEGALRVHRYPTQFTIGVGVGIGTGTGFFALIFLGFDSDTDSDADPDFFINLGFL